MDEVKTFEVFVRQEEFLEALGIYTLVLLVSAINLSPICFCQHKPRRNFSDILAVALTSEVYGLAMSRLVEYTHLNALAAFWCKGDQKYGRCQLFDFTIIERPLRIQIWN